MIWIKINIFPHPFLNNSLLKQCIYHSALSLTRDLCPSFVSNRADATISDLINYNVYPAA